MGINVVINGVTDILNLSAVAQFPEPSFQILLLNGGQIFSDMAVKTVAHIGSVRNIFHNAVHFPELLHLQAAQALCRGSVDGIKPAVFFFKFIYFLIDILQNFQGKLPSSAMDFPLYSSWSSFKAVMPKDAVMGFNSFLIRSWGFKWPP